MKKIKTCMLLLTIWMMAVPLQAQEVETTIKDKVMALLQKHAKVELMDSKFEDDQSSAFFTMSGYANHEALVNKITKALPSNKIKFVHANSDDEKTVYYYHVPASNSALEVAISIEYAPSTCIGWVIVKPVEMP